jgi:alpha-aminoadipic semialdehyde synthase
MIGIRHEDKSVWETRAPLVPDDVRRLIQDAGVAFRIQTSPTRAFSDADYASAGATVASDVDDCPIVLGVKEIPAEKLLPDRTYVYFSHVIKGQPSNMPALRRLMQLGCRLIDYEKIVDAQGRRLVFFGRFAGLAGMIDTLWALGQRWQHEGIETPFASLHKAYQYDTLEHAKAAITDVGNRLRKDGLPEACQPLVFGFAGYGQVSQGAQEIGDLLPMEEVAPADLPGVPRAPRTCFKSVFYEKHMVDRLDGSEPFNLQEYYDHPGRYRGVFAPYVPHLTVLVNGIYWEAKYPRLVTLDLLRDLYAGPALPRLRVIGDITADVDGSIQCNLRPTEPDNPVYVYEPRTGTARDGVAGHGPVVLAVDHLPCELPVDSSRHFSRSLAPLVPAIARADFRGPLEECGLPPELTAATIVYNGRLTGPYRYLQSFLER